MSHDTSPHAQPGGQDATARLSSDPRSQPAVGLGRALGRLSIRTRLFALAAAVAVLGAVAVAVATSGLIGQKGKVHDVAATFRGFRTARNAYEGWLTADDQMNMYAALAILRQPGEQQLMAATWQQLAAGHAQAVSSLQTLIVSAPEARLRSAARAALADLNRYYAYTLRMRALVAAGRLRAGVHEVTVSNAGISNRVQADLQAISHAFTLRVAAIDAGAMSSASSSVQLVIVVSVVAVLLALVVTLLLARSIIRPLHEITSAAERISEGDLEVALPPEAQDEIGRLSGAFRRSVGYLTEMAGVARSVAEGDLTAEVRARSERDVLGTAFARMRERLAAAIQEIARSSDSVGSASAEMAQSSQQAGMAVGEIANAVGSVAEGAETQVRALEQAREVTVQVAAASQASAADAEQTALAARQAREVAEQGATSVRRASDAMRAVHESSSEITERMRELGAMSEQIGGIVETITGIAEQTNLLALNAAIEAARAGEQGKGFAVVAEEVRKLAEESQTAAGSIAQLISQIQTGTTKAIEVVSTGARQTEEGVGIVDEARQAFEAIDASVQDMDERVQRIATAVAEIVTAGAQMQESIEQVLSVAEQSSASAEQVSATTEQTSASAQQIAASAGELANTAEALQGIVRQFRLAVDGSEDRA
ncbi:MAG TPA: HAMP domain-containing methyl-accepting chemotaxis protein [Solirubrobacteraceae bacterium]|nr:HAMP domain-containing methyl-accepting chemotaxis protein [Solirubrobacteraceae bacterium]